jgi:triosephosphate isomerase
MTAKRLITITDVEVVREKGGAALEVPSGAIVTPLARDAARRLGVALAPAGKRERPALVFGNWKANGTLAQARRLAREVALGWCGSGAPLGPRRAALALFPPLVHVAAVSEALAGTSIALGAQDLSEKGGGAFTGGVTAEMLADIGCRYALVGHSERRREFGDADDVVAAKLRRALAAGLEPVLCVGETLEERDAARTHAVLRGQTLAAFDGLSAEQAARVVVAYEPVWAIGTGLTPSLSDAEDAMASIKDHLARKFGDEVAGGARVLYGGSVAAENAARFLALASCDGALVGGASLKAREFLTIAGAPA